MSGVKEYVAWRGLPRDLSLRVKKHYAFYFTRRAAFDEIELLGGLSPSLRSEVTRYVLRETLGKLPLFAQQLDPEFQLEVFPLLKPVSYAKGEIVFMRGEPSRDLIFLLKGEVAIVSPIDDSITSIIHAIPEGDVIKTKEVVLSKSTLGAAGSALEVVMELEHSGSFGEDVLTGRRRQATHKANAWCETLVLTKDDLISLFDRNARQGRRIVKKLLGEVARREKRQGLMKRFLIGAMPKTSETRAALVIQRRWNTFQALVAAADETNKGLISLGVGEVLQADGPTPPSAAPTAAPTSAPAATRAAASLPLPLAGAIAEAKGLRKVIDAQGVGSAEEVLKAAEAKVEMLFEALRKELVPP